MTQYIPPPHTQPPPNATRSRQSSTASMNKYHPDNYRPGPPSGPLGTSPGVGYPAPPPPPPLGSSPGGSYFPPTSRPRGPSMEGKQVPSMPPIPQNGSYNSTTPGMPIPTSQPRLQPGYPTTPASQPGYATTPSQLAPPSSQVPPYPPSVDRDGYMRPLPEPRRLSAASSTHSRRSHDSRRSHRSSRRSSEGRSGGARRSSDYDHERERRRSGDDRPKRAKTHRPTWGDTVFGMFDVIKSALGPRDKY